MNKEFQNETDIVALILKMQEKLAALDKKVDVLVSRSAARPTEVRPTSSGSSQGPVHAHDPVPGLVRTQEQRPAKAQESRPGRQMYQVTCAECQKDCEIPFKPNGDRPVYCKECFSRRKSSGAAKASAESKSPETPCVQAPVEVASPVLEAAEAPVKEKRKPVVAKKPAAKKKPAPKKKK